MWKLVLKIVFVIVIFVGIGILIDKIIGVKTAYEEEIKSSEAKISVLTEKNTSLAQDTARLLKSLDSISELLKTGNLEVAKEVAKRRKVEADFRKESARVKKLSDQEQVKYFLTKTGSEYDIVKYDGFYLIKLSSISEANKIFVDSEFHLKNNLTMLSEIQSLNNLVFDYKNQVKTLTDYVQMLDKMLSNKDKIIANLNNIVGLKDRGYARLKLSKNISLGIAVTAVVLMAVK